MINLKPEIYQNQNMFWKENQCSLQGPARARICKAMMRTQIGMNRYSTRIQSTERSGLLAVILNEGPVQSDGFACASVLSAQKHICPDAML